MFTIFYHLPDPFLYISPYKSSSLSMQDRSAVFIFTLSSMLLISCKIEKVFDRAFTDVSSECIAEAITSTGFSAPVDTSCAVPPFLYVPFSV